MLLLYIMQLHFRESISGQLEYEQNDDKGVETVYGLSNEESELNEFRGYVETKEDRCICFPNLFQHQVQPFSLLDRSKPGVSEKYS